MKQKWIGVTRRLATVPVPATLFVLALGLFVWGAYIVTPFFNPGAGFLAFAHHRLIEIAVGIIYMIIGGFRLAGALFKSTKLLLRLPYGMMMAYLFTALLHIEVVGWFPLTWVPLVICAVIAGICRLAILYGGKVE